MNTNEKNFQKDILQRLGLEFEVEKRENGSYTFEHPEYGIIDIFPKRQRMLIRKKNKWHSQCFTWIKKNIINDL